MQSVADGPEASLFGMRLTPIYRGLWGGGLAAPHRSFWRAPWQGQSGKAAMDESEQAWQRLGWGIVQLSRSQRGLEGQAWCCVTFPVA